VQRRDALPGFDQAAELREAEPGMRAGGALRSGPGTPRRPTAEVSRGLESERVPSGRQAQMKRQSWPTRIFSRRGHEPSSLPRVMTLGRCTVPPPGPRPRSLEALSADVHQLKSNTCGVSRDLSCSASAYAKLLPDVALLSLCSHIRSALEECHKVPIQVADAKVTITPPFVLERSPWVNDASRLVLGIERVDALDAHAAAGGARQK
jgi:hypothetical protein